MLYLLFYIIVQIIPRAGLDSFVGRICFNLRKQVFLLNKVVIDVIMSRPVLREIEMDGWRDG